MSSNTLPLRFEFDGDREVKRLKFLEAKCAVHIDAKESMIATATYNFTVQNHNDFNLLKSKLIITLPSGFQLKKIIMKRQPWADGGEVESLEADGLIDDINLTTNDFTFSDENVSYTSTEFGIPKVMGWIHVEPKGGLFNMQLDFTAPVSKDADGELGIVKIPGMLPDEKATGAMDLNSVTTIKRLFVDMTGAGLVNATTDVVKNGRHWKGYWAGEVYKQKVAAIAVKVNLAHSEIAELARQAENLRKPKVFARIRPLSKEEKEAGYEVIKELNMETTCRKEDGDTIVVLNPGVNGFEGSLSPRCKNKEAYDLILKPDMPFVKDGGNVNVFCYGHSGTGKTHTTMGYDEEPGLFKQAADEIFDDLKKRNEGLEPDAPKFQFLQIRFSEVYLGRIYDLLKNREECVLGETELGDIRIQIAPKKIQTGQKSAEAKWDPVTKTIQIPQKYGKVKLEYSGEQEFKAVKNSEHLMETMKCGLELRAVGTSSIHDQSSRSHAIMEIEIIDNELCKKHKEAQEFETKLHQENLKGVPSKQVVTKMKGKIQKINEERKAYIVESAKNGNAVGGRLTLVDLAGADHDTRDLSKATKQELVESAKINTELFTLGSIMRGLALQANRLPWRDEKLTLFLKNILMPKESLTGVVQSIMVANVSPSMSNRKDVVNTLRYAQRVAGLSEKQINAGVDKNFQTKQNIRDMYHKHTNKTDEEIDVILGKFEGRERMLFQKVMKKYAWSKPQEKKEDESSDKQVEDVKQVEEPQIEDNKQVEEEKPKQFEEDKPIDDNSRVKVEDGRKIENTTENAGCVKIMKAVIGL